MVEWITSDSYVPYPDAVAQMESHVADMIAGTADERIWLLEHPPLYTAGTSANIADLTDPDRFPVYTSKRGGQYTYHGPGQRVAYAMLDLNKRGRDVRKFVASLEDWVIQTLAEFNVRGERREGRVCQPLLAEVVGLFHEVVDPLLLGVEAGLAIGLAAQKCGGGGRDGEEGEQSFHGGVARVVVGPAWGGAAGASPVWYP